MRLRPRQLNPYLLYLILESGTAFLSGISFATVTVYWVTVGRLNPLQLLLLGTALGDVVVVLRAGLACHDTAVCGYRRVGQSRGGGLGWNGNWTAPWPW